MLLIHVLTMMRSVQRLHWNTTTNRINGFISDGNWVHCNFAARQPNEDVDGKSSRRLFFAEMCGDDDATTCTFCIVLEGSTALGCSFCSGVIHPTHGFHQGHYKPDHLFVPTTSLPTSIQPTGSLMPYVKNPPLIIPPPEPYYRDCTEKALEYYNKENGANYELLDVVVCKCLSSGTWFHCNFTAKQPNGDSPSKLFFGEVHLTTKTGTACVILEEGSETMDSCYLCPDSEVIKPIGGFLKGLDKNEVRVFCNPETGRTLRLLI